MMRRNLTFKVLTFAFLLGIAIIGAQPALAQEGTEVVEKSLYERLGGVYSIATVVDELINRLDGNEVLNANPLIDAARKKAPKAGIKFRLTALICQLTGGPEVYHGRNMTSSHAHLGINEAQWDEMVKVFIATLDHFSVPEKEKGELLALVGPTKAQIVTAK